MEETKLTSEVEFSYPVLLIPKICTKLESHCETSDNVFIDLNITSLDTEGNEICIYNGLCNVKLVENCEVNINEIDSNNESPGSYDKNPPVPVTETNNQLANTAYNHSQVWIDPARSPYVYNSYDSLESQQCYSVYHQTNNGHITVEQRSTYITQNVYNYKEDCLEQKECKRNDQDTIDQFYKDNEFQCDLSQLSEGLNDKEKIKGDYKTYKQSDNEALNQLMSSDIQSGSKQKKTILYLGKDSHYGETIQNIAINDPSLECLDSGHNTDYTIAKGKTNKKKYQCDKCKQIFAHLAEFKHHTVSNHKAKSNYELESLEDVEYMCTECSKTFKSQEKFERHCQGHGDPELECSKCNKVFASKFTLRTHLKIHNRKYTCDVCMKSYTNMSELEIHKESSHFEFICHFCNYTTDKESDMKNHKEIHCTREMLSSDTDSALSLDHSDANNSNTSFEDKVKRADLVINKIMNNDIFHLHSKKAKRTRPYNKNCDVCHKNFDRIGDLKRHLIEHVIRSTLAKTPVNKNGTLTIQCEVCQHETFNKVDKYKAHLREHAKLTLYKCTFCDKSFSDSSNFSKHKKVHGITFFQCDICQRKFNSKKMITQHLEYHQNNEPISCFYCDKEFHFESMLNKHIKCAHTRELTRFRCRFCSDYFKSLKEKWDHEWKIHNVRKLIVDCLICGAKFRKYSELKRHCSVVHNMEIPMAKKLIKNY